MLLKANTLSNRLHYFSILKDVTGMRYDGNAYVSAMHCMGAALRFNMLNLKACMPLCFLSNRFRDNSCSV